MEITEAELSSEAAEKTLMGVAGHRPDAISAILSRLPAEDFYNPHRGYVWAACRHLSAERQMIDPTAVARSLVSAEHWGVATQHVVAVEMSNAPAMHLVETAASTIADLARRRELMRTVGRARALVIGHDGDASDVLEAIRASFDDLDTPERELGGTRTWGQMLAEFEIAHDPDNAIVGIPTPWKELDDLIGGLFGGRLYVIGGSAGDGKSTAALNMASHAAHEGRHVLVFSKEMPTLDVFGRLVSARSEVELGQINRRELTDFQRAKIRKYARESGDLSIRVNADPVSIGGIKTIARSLHHRGLLDLLIVDYLQLIDTGAASRSQEEEIAKVSTALKQLAMELDIPLVVPAQLNRSPHARPDARPTKADLRGSGRIEQDADVVMLLWHQTVDGRRTGEVTFILDKNRHGPRGEFVRDFNGGYGAIA